VIQSQDFTLHTEYIDLSQLLKAAGLVTVNGDPESRKRRKLRGGDVVVFNNEHKVCIITT
jgi:ribosome-associated protein YbcJ (S4-like RNA binding protein)